MKIAIYGIGNVLTGDDAVGPTVVRYLESHFEFPQNVVLEDLGTPSLDLAEHLVGFDTAIFIDAVAANGNPGEIRIYDRSQIVKNPPSIRMSPHDPSLKETLLAMELVNDAPSVVKLIGVIPKSLNQFGLSDEVRNAVTIAASAVLGELDRLGVSPAPRPTPLRSPAFWEAGELTVR